MFVVCVLYAFLVVGWNALRLTPVAAWGPFEVADLFGWVLFVPAPVLIAVTVLRRRWLALVVLLLPAVIFGVEYGPQLLPHRVPQGESIRLVTANVFEGNERLEEATAALLAQDADVIAIQELGSAVDDALTPALRPRYPHQIRYATSGWHGLGVYSRFPLREVAPLDVETGSCRCQIVAVQAPGREMTLINAHARRPGLGPRGFDTSEQVATLRALIDAVEDAGAGVVLAGDLNLGDRHYLYRDLRAHLGDAHRDAGWGLGLTWTYQRRWEVVRIDYVLHGASWAASSAFTAPVPGSDHRSVTADLVWRDTTAGEVAAFDGRSSEGRRS